MMTLALHLATLKTNRAGLIPYTIENGSIYFLLTRDKVSRELGDFGGGVRKTEVALTAALREFYEESHGIFSHIYKSANDISNKIAMVDGVKMAMVFVPLESRWITDAQKMFMANPATSKKSDEVSELVWVDEATFYSLIIGSVRKKTNDTLWTEIQKFLEKTYKPKRAEMQVALRAVASAVA